MGVKVYYDDYLLYSTTIENLKIVSPKTSQEVNKTGSFTFTIYSNHPYYSAIQRFKGIVTVYDDGVTEPLFRGRIIKDEKGFYNQKNITCEGELAFLLDSIQRPYSFTGTPEELFRQYISFHNSQVDELRQFTVGTVTVTDPNDYIVRSNSDYVSTWKEINDKLIKNLGGYLWVRHESGVNYIDYLADFTTLSNQKVEFGKNLLDIKQLISAESFYTALIPLGAKDEETGERITIKSVNDDVDYVYNADAVAQYGYIFTTQTWDDVTEPSNLKRKAQQQIDDLARFTASITISAADLNGTGVNVNSFRIGRYIEVDSGPHGISHKFVCSKLVRQLDNPAATKLTLGASSKTLTDLSSSQVIQGKDGKNGKDGVSTYLWLRYASDSAGSDMKDTPDSSSKFIGTATTLINLAPSDPADYKWSEYVGADGVSGSPGADGKTSYIHIAYANSADGKTGFDTTDGTDKLYIGQYTDYVSTDSTDPSDYTWTRIKGEQGIQGEKGDTGAKGDKGDKGDTGDAGKDAAIQSDTEPSDKTYLWLDTSLTPPLMKRWNSDDETWDVVNDTTNLVYNLKQELTSSIENTQSSIMSTVSESYYVKSETDALVSSVITSLEQTANGFTMQFSEINADIDDVISGTDAKFSEISKYIRFIDGNIVLGEAGNQLELKIANDRISFIQNNSEVAYFSNNKLNVTDGEFINSLRLGNFAFSPRTNNNLSFSKIT